MLPTAGSLPDDDAAWAFEVKWDGTRVLARVESGQLRLVSRNGNDVTSSYPELGGLVAQLGHPAVLDGEIVVLAKQGRSDFSLLQSRMHVRKPSRRLLESHPVQLVVFDVLHHSGRSLIGDSYDERRRVLEDLALSGPHWQAPAAVPGSGAQVLAATKERGLEGVVAKRRSSVYRPGTRSRQWVKTKNIRRTSTVIAGWVPGEGGRGGRIGSLLLAVHGETGLEYAGHVGTGFTDAVLESLALRLQTLQRPDCPLATSVPQNMARPATWVEPVLVAEIDYTEWTSTGRLRHPSFKGLREDYDPEAVVRE